MRRREFLVAVGALVAEGFVAAPGSWAEGSRIDWGREAREASDYVQRTFWDERAGLYRPSSPADPDPKTLPYDFMWANGVQFSALVAAARHEPERYRPVLERFFQGLDRYWDRRAPVPAYDAYFSKPDDSDKYYDDNEWMVITLVEAYRDTQDVRYLDRAEAAMNFALSGWDEVLGGGIYWKEDHKSKNTCSNGPAAEAALALARYRNREGYLRWAKRIVEWTNRTLQAPDGTFWDNIDRTGKRQRTRWTYNTALMLRADLDLYRFTREASYLDEAKRLAQASVKEFINPATGAFRDDALFSHLLVEAFLDLYKETKEPYLLDTARKNAEFLVRSVRDPTGGYFTSWKVAGERNEPRKRLMANAAAARLLWVMSEADPASSP
jgi:uncharacterized protein YyaL (SSP411 family)